MARRITIMIEGDPGKERHAAEVTSLLGPPRRSH